jgi:hypothetical protein
VVITHNEHGVFLASSAHGQTIYADPAEIAIARLSSQPVCFNAANNPTSPPAYDTIAIT